MSDGKPAMDTGSEELDELDELIDGFLDESRERLADIEATLLALEAAHGSEATVDDIHRLFRHFHSIKGSAALLCFSRIVEVTHRAESVLDVYRQREELPTEQVCALLLGTVDFTSRTCGLIEQSRTDVAAADEASGFITRLDEVLDQLNGAGPPAAADPAPVPATSPAPSPAAAPAAATDAAPAPAPASPPPAGAEPAGSSAIEATPPAAAAAHPAPPPPTPVAAQPPAPVAPVPEPLAAPAPAPERASDGDAANDDPAARKATPSAQSQGGDDRRESIRIDVGKLDALMNLVGELIIAENMVGHADGVQKTENFSNALAQLNRISRDLQDVAMSMRMVPLDATFRKMVRLVRDLGIKQGKSITVELDGAATEVDKTVIENVADPLVHLIRNAVDHGVETPQERVATGKPPRATIRLEACHRGGEVWIRVLDDGRGIHRDRILKKARDRGLFAGNDAELSDAEVFQFIFEPGFSTAEKLTDVSGRGVGMDVVRRNIEALRGRIEVDSRTGHGSEFTLRIPLTLAIIEGMLMRVGKTRYTLPLLSIRESISPSEQNIEVLPTGQELLDVRGRLVPILRLHRFHGVEGAKERVTDAIIVVVDEGDSQVGLMVDELVGQYQTVIKPLPTMLGQARGLSGVSLLANGDLSLIIEVKAILAAMRNDLPGGRASHDPVAA